MRTHDRGFTLIELMIVVAIVAILASIAIPAYQDFTVRAQVSEGLSLASGLKNAVSSHRLEMGVFPSNNASAGVAASTSVVGQFVTQTEVGAGGIVTVTYGGPQVHQLVSGATLRLVPSFRGGSVEWDCTSTIATRYLPSQCR